MPRASSNSSCLTSSTKTWRARTTRSCYSGGTKTGEEEVGEAGSDFARKHFTHALVVSLLRVQVGGYNPLFITHLTT